MPKPWMRQLFNLSPAYIALAMRAELPLDQFAGFGTVKHAEHRCIDLRGMIIDRRWIDAKGGSLPSVLCSDD